MASLADVLTEKERTNWLKAWLAVDIAKSGLEKFVENEAKDLHKRIYTTVRSHVQSPAVCSGCHTANLLKCPTPGICNKRGKYSPCTSMHDDSAKKPRPCSANVCDHVRDEIAKEHRYSLPSWKNTQANFWASNPWQIAKAFLPPDGYAEKHSVNDTDFNGIISFIINCKQFDSKFSFLIAPGKPHSPCHLTKARDIGKTVRHSSQCKITDTILQDIFTTLNSLFTDSKYLAQDIAAREAVRKLTELKADVLKITTEEMMHLLREAQRTLKKVETVSDKTLGEMRVYMEHCRNELEAVAAKCKDDIEEQFRKSDEKNYEQSREDFTRHLVTLYTSTLTRVAISPLNESIQEKIGRIFVTPNMQRMIVNKGSFQKTGIKVTKYKDVVIKDDQLNKHIFIQGEAGIGKTTFIAKLVLDWCSTTIVEQFSKTETADVATFFDDLTTLQYYTFVFHVTLRHSVNDFEIYKMITEQLIDNIYSNKKDRKKAYKLLNDIMNREPCLILLDGLDEWIGPRDHHNIPTLVKHHSNCALLITTRPWKLVEANIKISEIDTLLQLEGINDPQTMSRNILGCLVDETLLDKKCSAFLSYIEEQKLGELLASPVMLSVIVCSYAEGTTLKGSKCEIYSLLLDSLLKKATYKKKYFKKPPFTCFRETQCIQPNMDHVHHIAEAAFRLLFSDQRENALVFGAYELEAVVDDADITIALKAGILTETKASSIVRSLSTFSFIHKSLQEFLAACHIASNAAVINDVIYRYLKRYDTAYLDITQVFIFLCGLNISVANALSSIMNDCNVDHNRTESSKMYQTCVVDGYREAVSNAQSDINLKISYFIIDNDCGLPALQNLWDINSSSALSLRLYVTGGSLFTLVVDLSLCHKLKYLKLEDDSVCGFSGTEIGFTDFPSSATSKFPVWICLNWADQARCTDAPSVLPSIEHIDLRTVTCSSTWLHSLFSTLRTLDHEVRCDLEDCDITFPKNEYSYVARASITTTSLCERFNMKPWTICGLNIKNLTLRGSGEGLKVLHGEALSQALSSLPNLDTLTNDVDFINRLRRYGSYKETSLDTFNIPVIQSNYYPSARVVASYSRKLSKLTRLHTLTICLVSYINLDLPPSLLNLNVYCTEFSPRDLSDLLKKLSVCTKILDIRLEFGCVSLTRYLDEQEVEVYNERFKLIRCWIYPNEQVLDFDQQTSFARLAKYFQTSADIFNDHDDVKADYGLYNSYLDSVFGRNRFVMSFTQVYY